MNQRRGAISSLFAVALSMPPAFAAPPRQASPPDAGDAADFALTLYRETAALKPGKNALVSPFSAREAVGLAYVGARGETAAGLARTLRAASREDFVASLKRTRREIQAADPLTTVESANSLWLRSQWRFLDSYVARAKDGFDAEVFSRDFSPSVVAEADAWVSRRTHGKITKAVEELKPDDVAVLLNTVYFKGVWKRPFDKSKTKDRDFRLASGRSILHPRMAFGLLRPGDLNEFSYFEDADLQAVRLPYGSGRLAMIVLLPAKTTTLAAIAGKLSGTWWRTLRARMEDRAGEVELPRFKSRASMRLNDPLIAMGAGAAFDDRADFRDMAEARGPQEMLRISEVRQEAVVEVDETGTVAAAKTAVLVARKFVALREPPPFVFIADRPFLFAIEDAASGALLFVGSLQDPR